MQNEKPFSEQESLQLIDSMINKARNQFNENGHLYILWGWVVLICSVTEFVLLELHYKRHYQIWFVTWIAVIYQVIYLIKRKKRQKVRTYTGNIMGSVWLSFIITMFLIVFAGNIIGAEFNKVINPLLLALYGIPTFISGTILRFNPLIVGGVSCWIFSALAQVVPNQYHLLLVGAALVVAWIIPGYLLRKKYQQSNLL